MSENIMDTPLTKKPASEKANSLIKESRSMSPIRKLNRYSNNSSVTPETGLSGNTQPELTTNEGLNKSQLEAGMTSSDKTKSDRIFDNSDSSQKGFYTSLLLQLDN